MAELTPQDRLQPSLLDRLTDEDPSRTVEPREARVLSPARLRDSVRRDLSWLFNTTHLAAIAPDVGAEPHVASSVLNYGVPPLNGQSAGAVARLRIEKLLRDAIIHFEPRLLPHTVELTLELNKRMDARAVVFTISAELWAQPLPLHLFLRAAVDMDNGQVSVDTPQE